MTTALRRLIRLAERDGGWRCHYCGRELVDPLHPEKSCIPSDTSWIIPSGLSMPEADHVIPRSRGGSHADENRVLACGPCNRRKGTSGMAA